MEKCSPGVLGIRWYGFEYYISVEFRNPTGLVKSNKLILRIAVSNRLDLYTLEYFHHCLVVDI